VGYSRGYCGREMEMNRSVRLFSVRLAAALLLVGQVAPAQDAGGGKLPLWKVTGENSTTYVVFRFFDLLIHWHLRT